MRRTTHLITVLAIAPTLCACDGFYRALVPCMPEEPTCLEQQPASCAAPEPAQDTVRLPGSARLELPGVIARQCSATGGSAAQAFLTLDDSGSLYGGVWNVHFRPEEELCRVLVDVRFTEYDPKQEQHFVFGGEDARVRLCHADLAIYQAPSYADISIQLASATILSGDDPVELLRRPVELPIVSGDVPDGCPTPLADRDLDEVYDVFSFELVLAQDDLRRLFGGASLPSLRTTWRIEENQ